MGRRLKSVAIFFSAVSWASPAWANPSTSGPIGLLAVLGIPLLMLGLTAAGGADAIMRSKGIKRWRRWEIVVGCVMAFLFSGMSAELGLILILILGLCATARGLQMLWWGSRAKGPAAERPPHLAEAEPKRLMSAGLALLAATAVLVPLGMVGALSDMSMGHLIVKSNEGATKGNLGSIRSALSIYYGDTKGEYPTDLAALTVGGKYLKSLPRAKVPPHHSDSNAVRQGRSPDDSGGWFYDNDLLDSDFGQVFVNCTHTDTKGKVWTEY